MKHHETQKGIVIERNKQFVPYFFVSDNRLITRDGEFDTEETGVLKLKLASDKVFDNLEDAMK